MSVYYRCGHCVYDAATQPILKIHANHHLRKSQCPSCREKYANRMDLSVHLEEQHGMFFCGGSRRCVYSTLNRDYIETHKNMYCGQPRLYNCQKFLCGFQASARRALTVHQAQHNSDELLDNSIARLFPLTHLPENETPAGTGLDQHLVACEEGSAALNNFSVEGNQEPEEPTVSSNSSLGNNASLNGRAGTSASKTIIITNIEAVDPISLQPIVSNVPQPEHQSVQPGTSTSTLPSNPQSSNLLDLGDEEQALSAPREDLDEASGLMDNHHPHVNPNFQNNIDDPILGSSASTNVESLAFLFQIEPNTQICGEREKSPSRDCLFVSSADALAGLSKNL